MTDRQTQQEIRTALEVVDPDTFDPAAEAERRIGFLTAYLEETGATGYVLGISGGVDSTTAGRLAQLACERVRERGGEATFVAVRLPYHVQKDEHDAQDALRFIDADEVWTVDIGPSVDASWEALLAAGLDRDDPRGEHPGEGSHRGTRDRAAEGALLVIYQGSDQREAAGRKGVHQAADRAGAADGYHFQQSH